MEGDVGEDLESLAVLVALDPLGGLAGNNAADGAGAVGDGGSEGGAEAVDGRWEWRREEYNDDEGEGEGKKGGGWIRCHLEGARFFFFI